MCDMVNDALIKFKKKLIDKRKKKIIENNNKETGRSGLLDYSENGEMVFVDQL